MNTDWTAVLAARGLEAPGYQETVRAAREAREELRKRAVEELVLKQQKADEKLLQQAYREGRRRKRKR